MRRVIQSDDSPSESMHAWPRDRAYKTLCEIPGDWVAGLGITMSAAQVTCKDCLIALGINVATEPQWTSQLRIRKLGAAFRAEMFVAETQGKRSALLTASGDTSKDALATIILRFNEYLDDKVH